MKAFTLTVPTRIYFGTNQLGETLEKLSGEIPRRIMLVTGGRSADQYGYAQQVIDCLGPKKEVMRWNEISANPKTGEINRAIKKGRQEEVKLIIGLGGGSALDGAKAIAAGIGMKKNAEDFLESGITPDENTLPVIAIPTTAGTGSELSKGAIISDPIRQIKTGIRGEALYPKAAIVDPALTMSAPMKITMETGFDVMAHGIESLISVQSSPFTEMLSREAICEVAKNLKRLHKDLTDLEARETMSYYSMLMGINLGNASTALPHRLQYPVGALTDTSHGAGLLALYPAWLKHGYRHSREKFKMIASLIAGEEKQAEEITEVFNRFVCELELNRSLKEFGLEEKEETVKKLTEAVTGNLKNDPASMDKEIVRKIYEDSF